MIRNLAATLMTAGLVLSQPVVGHAQLGGELDCLLQPSAQADLSTREQGVIERLFVERGDSIEPGQPLAELESGVERASVELFRSRASMGPELEEARLNQEFAERRLARVKELYSQNAVSFENQDQVATDAALAALRLKQVEHERDTMRLELERAQRQLEQRTIRSPFAGVVVDRYLEVGETVEDRPIMSVAQVDPLYVEVIVPVANFGVLKRGDLAAVTPRLPGAIAQQASVTAVDRLVDAASGTIRVRLELPNPGNEIPGGIRCDIRFLDN